MKNLWIFILIIVSPLIVTACVTSPLRYDIKVNGFKAGNNSITAGKKIFVYRNNKAVNPLLEEEIGKKIENALGMKGYIPVERLSKSEYVLVFKYSIDQGKTYTRTYSYGGTRLNINSGELEPTTNVGSRIQTIYNRQLRLSLIKTKRFLIKESKPVWIGEINSSGSSSDLRKVIDYLIIGAFEHFGIDTKGQKRHFYLLKDNPFEYLKKVKKE